MSDRPDQEEPKQPTEPPSEPPSELGGDSAPRLPTVGGVPFSEIRREVRRCEANNRRRRKRRDQPPVAPKPRKAAAGADAPRSGEERIREAIEAAEPYRPEDYPDQPVAHDAPEGAPPAYGPPASPDKLVGPEVENCPVKPLGHYRGVYYYLNPAGEVQPMKSGEHRKEQLKGLFLGRTAWPHKHFEADSGGISWDRCGTWLMRCCSDRGLFDPNTPLRGPGVWRAPGDRAGAQGLIVHAGDAVLLEGDWRPPGLVLGRAIYAAQPPVERPAAKPASAKLGQQLLEDLRRWRYADALGPELLCGFIGAAMYGGAPDWRVHLLAIGQRGSGKTWLSNLVKATLGGGAVDASDVTEAGLRQMLTGEARAVVLDEAESEEGTAKRINAVILLLRRMADEGGAKTWRGSAGGTAQNFAVTGCAYLGAILPPDLKPQDRSRITVVRLKPLPVGTDQRGAADAVRAAIQRLGEESPALRARALAAWPRFLDSFNAYRGEFLGRGLDGRDSDRIATLLAGRDMLICDDVPAEGALHDEADRCLPLIEEAAEQDEEGEGQLCLNHLYTHPIERWRGGDLQVLSEVLRNACEPTGTEDRRALERYGLRVVTGQKPDARGSSLRLWVANNHVMLQRIFAGTAWAGKRWVTALRYLPGAEPSTTAARFAGAPSRYTIVPGLYLPLREAAEAGDEEGEPQPPVEF